MKKEKLVASALAFNTLLTAFTINAKAKTLDVPYIYEEEKYGESQLGRELNYYHIENEKQNLNSKKLLLNFAIHGFEDAFDYDGQLLVKIAENIISYYEENYDKLGSYELYIIKCSNPDGTYEGYTNNGYGRCTSTGVDLNRHFDYYHQKKDSARYYSQEPFSAVESQALRDVTIKIKPDIVIDCHGWLNGYYGSYNLYQKFSQNFYLPYCGGYGSGYYSSWATTIGAEGTLLEFPWPSNDHDKFIETYSNKMIDLINGVASETLNEQQNLEKNECNLIVKNRKYFPYRSSIKIGGTNYYSLTDIARMLEFEMSFEEGKIVLKNNNDYLTFYPCTNVIQVQDNHYNLSVNSFENNGEIFVPLREVLELLGHSVEWNGKTNSIYIDSNIILSRKLVVENS